MKYFFFSIVATALVSTAIPASAQDRHDHQDHNRPQQQHRHVVQPRRNVVAHRYYQGQNWHGHRLANRGGNWGYYQPRNGTQVFIRIPI